MKKRHGKQKKIKKTTGKIAGQRFSSARRIKKRSSRKLERAKLVSKNKKKFSRPGRITKSNQRTGKTIIARKPGKGNDRKASKQKQVSAIDFQAENVSTIFDGTRERKDDVTKELIDVPSKVFEFQLPKGSFKDKVDYIRNFDFDSFVKQYRSVEYKKKGYFNRSFLVSLHSKFRNKEYSRTKLTAPDFASMDGNALKQFVLDRMIAFQDNFLERKDQIEENEEEMKESDKAFNPDKLSTITIKFIY